MKKTILLSLVFLLTASNVFSAPSNSIGIPYTHSPNTTISSSEANSNNNEVQTKYNVHTHTDITSLGAVTTGTWNATDVAVADGGTGSSTAAAARTALGLAIGTDVQASNATLDDLADGSLSGAGTCNTSALTGTTYVPDNTVDTTALKDSSVEVTYGTSLSDFDVEMARNFSGASYVATVAFEGGNNTTLTGAGAFGFYPQLKLTGGVAYAKCTYITASGVDLWVFLLADKDTGDILRASAASDHPAYGNGGDFDKVPHPFLDYDSDTEEVILLSKDTCNQLKQEQKDIGVSILTLVNEKYKPDMTQEYKYEPLHSGEFIDTVPVIVKSIPDYIKVRKLVKLTAQEKTDKETTRQQKIAEREAKKAQKEANKKQAENKLKALGLTKDELTALFE